MSSKFPSKLSLRQRELVLQGISYLADAIRFESTGCAPDGLTSEFVSDYLEFAYSSLKLSRVFKNVEA